MNNGHNGQGAIQRAELFANVDELLAWKKTFEVRQHDELVRQREQVKVIESLIEAGQQTIEAITLVNTTVHEIGTKVIELETRMTRFEMRDIGPIVCDNLPGLKENEDGKDKD